MQVASEVAAPNQIHRKVLEFSDPQSVSDNVETDHRMNAISSVVEALKNDILSNCVGVAVVEPLIDFMEGGGIDVWHSAASNVGVISKELAEVGGIVLQQVLVNVEGGAVVSGPTRSSTISSPY